MSKNQSKLKKAQEEAQAAINKTNDTIAEFGEYTNSLYISLNDIQSLFDAIRNIPSDTKLEYEKLKEHRLEWKQQADKIECDYQAAAIKSTSAGVVGVGTGVAFAALAPTAAMGIASTFGVASTGTAISALTGAAAKSAALAWLGGGALAAGGGGMATGSALLTLAGPVGWAIAGTAFVATGLMFFKSIIDKSFIEDTFTLISKRDVKYYKLAIVELNERISRIDNENKLLEDAISKIKTFGTDYNAMTEAQQYELGAYVNLMSSSTQLLINPIMSLMPKFSDTDFDNYKAWNKRSIDDSILDKNKEIIIFLANLLYNITLFEKEKKLLYKTFKSNKELLKSFDMNKNEFVPELIDAAIEALSYKERLSKAAQKSANAKEQEAAPKENSIN